MSEEKVYCSMYSRNAELYHHGILGMKWGKMHGPPYPLDSKVSTGRRLKNTKGKSSNKNQSNQKTSFKKENEKDIELKNNIANIERKSENISKMANEVWEQASDEALKAMKTEEFKKDLDSRLFKFFGNGADDSDYFEMIRYEILDDMIREEKYTPNTFNKCKKIQSDIDDYYNSIDRVASKYKDKSKIENKIHEAADSKYIRYIRNHLDDYLYEDLEVDYMDNYPYSMEAYNKNHR